MVQLITIASAVAEATNLCSSLFDSMSARDENGSNNAARIIRTAAFEAKIQKWVLVPNTNAGTKDNTNKKSDKSVFTETPPPRTEIALRFEATKIKGTITKGTVNQ